MSEENKTTATTETVCSCGGPACTIGPMITKAADTTPATYEQALREHADKNGLTYVNSWWPRGNQIRLEQMHESIVDTIAAAPIFEGEFVVGRLRAGKVDGRTFGEGGNECSCLLGTMASAANLTAEGWQKPYRNGSDLGRKLSEKRINHRPAQDLFIGIVEGDKTENNLNAAFADQCITELLMSNRKVLGEERAALRRLKKFGLACPELADTFK